ncbi:MAG: A24 family peptidase [Clostridiales bacterium]|jgi:prepilin signal peptidase PulO-like enzyme (type II secretory pathway)|nr:A24 family peptidase [Clostridiales bacterium]
MLDVTQKITLVASLAVAAAIDARRGIIPNKIIVTGFSALAALLAARFIIFGTASGLRYAVSALLGTVAGGGPILAVIALSKGGMGAGDMKLMAMAGAYIGPLMAFAVLLVSIMTAGAYAAIMLALRLKTLKSRMAFGPFIAVAGIVIVVISRFSPICKIYP